MYLKKEIPPTCYKFHSILPDLNIALASVFVFPDPPVPEERKELETAIVAFMDDWVSLMEGNKKAVWRNMPTPENPNHVVKLYSQRMPASRIPDYRMRTFDVSLRGEAWFELTLAKPKESAASIVCQRRRRKIVRDGAVVEIDGYPFGFGAPDPLHPERKRDANTFSLRAYRPGSNPEWTGFEPVVLEVNRQRHLLSLQWSDDAERVSVVLAEPRALILAGA